MIFLCVFFFYIALRQYSIFTLGICMYCYHIRCIQVVIVFHVHAKSHALSVMSVTFVFQPALTRMEAQHARTLQYAWVPRPTHIAYILAFLVSLWTCVGQFGYVIISSRVSRKRVHVHRRVAKPFLLQCTK